MNETPQQRDARMNWWRQARFGMFIHWGLYSGLAGTWNGKPVASQGEMEWIQQHVGADTWEYARQAVPLFRPKEGFAEEWADVAQQAGCRYVVFTTKHHDGFGLFDSKYTTFDAYDMMGRDLCREYVDALRRKNLMVGFYHSVIDWHHPQYDYTAAPKLPHPLQGTPSPNGPRNHRIYVDYLHRQVRELMSNYGPVDILWWDYSREGSEGEFWQSRELMAMVRQFQPNIVSNNRLYPIPPIEKYDSVERLKTWKPEHGDFTTPEQTIPSTGIDGVDWEMCMTMNTTWGFSEHDTAWKSAKQLIQILVDIVSKGGNFLLNVGPTADGSIPPESVVRMQAIGRWMDVNAQAIYGTSASPFAAPAWGRCTKKDRTLYAHVFEWPGDQTLEIPVEFAKVRSACLLADERKTPLEISAQANGTIIHTPAKAPDENVSVIAIELKNEA